MATAPRNGWSAKWPLWAGHLAGAWAALAGLVLTIQALTGDHDLIGLARLAWPGAAVLLVGAVAAAATVRPWGRRLPAGLVTGALWPVAAASAAGSCFVLLNLIELAVTGSVTDRDGNSDWGTFGERLVGAVLAGLFIAAALSWRRRISGLCNRCGEAHQTGAVELVHPAPHTAPRRVRWTAYAGCAAFVPYLAGHGVATTGVIPGADEHYDSDGGVSLFLEFVGLAVGLVGPAVFLLLGLVRPWGMAFPRWTIWLAGRRVPRLLPLTPVYLVAPTLALYGVGSVPWAIASGHGHELWGIGGAASLAFGAYGSTLTVAAVSYLRRTRPRCATAMAAPERPVRGAGPIVDRRLS